MSENSNNYTNTGLYSGNVIIEFNTDQKVIKPVIKVNEKATPEEITNAVINARLAINQASFELYYNDYTIPDPIKSYIETTNKEMKEQRELEKEYFKTEDNDEILRRPKEDSL